MPTALTAWLHRATLTALLLAAYLWAWTPARAAWVTQGAALLEVVAGDDASPQIVARPQAPAIRVGSTAETVAKHTAPAGIKFLLPALVLVLIAPRRPRLGRFFAGHLGLGACVVGLLAAGTAGLPESFAVARFVEAYVVDAYSLAVPALAARPRTAPTD